MKRKTALILLSIILLTLITRLILAFSIPNFTYDSYFHLRQVQEIAETGSPLFNDPLSYGGRQFIFLPAFHYLLAFFDLFLPLEPAAKIISNVFISTIPLLAYLISKHITKNETASLLSAFTAAFLPILFTPHSFTPKILFLPLFLLSIYSFLNLNKDKFLYVYLISFLLASITNPATVLIVIGLGIYLFLSFIERRPIPKTEIELTLFSLLFYLWIQFVFFKKVLLQEGIQFIWQNVPPQIISSFFPSFSIIEAIVLISIIPILVGIYTVYRSLFNLRSAKQFLIISMVISTTLLLLFKLVEFKVGLSFIGLMMAILFASFYDDIMRLQRKTKFAHWRKLFLTGVVMLLIITTVYPAITTALGQKLPTTAEVTAFKWIKENTPAQATVISSLEEGHLVTYYGERKNLIDDNFALVDDAQERFEDLKSLFTTQFQTEAVSLFDRYNSSHIILTSQSRESFSIKGLKYLSSDCFQRVYREENVVKIYEARCNLEQI